MTPEQKEAHRREVLEEAAKVADGYRAMWCNAGGFGGHSAGARIIAGAIRALAENQPAADTGQAVGPFGYWCKHKFADGCLIRPPSYVPEGENYTVIPLYTHPAPLDAERVREAAQALMDTVDTIYRDGRYVQPSIITATAGLRAALRQKEGM